MPSVAKSLTGVSVPALVASDMFSFWYSLFGVLLRPINASSARNAFDGWSAVSQATTCCASCCAVNFFWYDAESHGASVGDARTWVIGHAVGEGDVVVADEFADSGTMRPTARRAGTPQSRTDGRCKGSPPGGATGFEVRRYTFFVG